jgi:hypothetical protein
VSRRDRDRKARNAARYAELRLGNLEPGQTIADTAACPDCNSEVEIERLAPGINRGVVRHDDTCPWYTAFVARAGRRG